MKELKGHNGVKIVINPAPFKLVKRLRQCIAKELLKHKVDVGNPTSFDDLKGSIKGNISEYLNIIKDIILGLEVSEDFESVLWECMSECTYKNIAITESLFDDIPTAREDYDLIVMEVIQENLAPFLKSLLGLFAMQEVPTEENQQ